MTMIGKTVGKYRFIERLGRGGMGTVYKALDETLDREVAIKVLNPELTDGEVMKRFRAEATTLAKLNHPEIATIFEILRSDDDLLMVMELVRGETLERLAQRCGPLPPERAAYLVGQVLDALEHAHGAGIVHRDLKPANVMVTEHGGVKIMDFGIARVAGAEHLTSDGHMMGTPAYMAPEQVVAKEVDARADLYAAGVLFYRLLTGNLPFQADTAIGMVQKQLSDQPTPAHVHRADLPDWCEDVLTRALQKSPADRFQTAEEFRRELLSRIGAAATERTGAFAASFGSTPQPLPVPGGLPTPGRALPVPTAAVLKAPPPAGAKVNPQTESPTVVLQRRHFAMAGALLGILAIGVAVLAYIALRRQNPVPVMPQTVAAAPETTPSSTSPTSAPADAATGVPATAQTDPLISRSTTPTASIAPSTPPAPPANASIPAESSSPKPAATAPAPVKKPPIVVASNTAAKPDASAAAPSGAATPTVAPVVTPEAPKPKPEEAVVPHPPFFFDAKTVVAEGGKNREHDTKILLASGKLTVTEGNDRLVTSVPFADIVGISVSSSRQPMWNSPQGPAEMMKVEAGKLGFFKGGRNWLGVRTADTSLVIRVDDEDLKKVIAAIEERTGKKVVRVVERKD
jgi:serine/threonine-protein kinase